MSPYVYISLPVSGFGLGFLDVFEHHWSGILSERAGPIFGRLGLRGVGFRV